MTSLLALPPLLLALAAPSPPAQVLDRVAAVVEGEVVTYSELVDRAGPEYARAMLLPPGEQQDRARSQALKAALDQVVAERLFDAEAKAQQAEASDAQVDAAITEIRQRNRFTDEAQFEQALREQGFTPDSFRRAVKRDLETYQLLNLKVRSRVKVTDEDVQNYYQSHPKEFAGEEQVKVRHILLALPQGATAAQEAAIRQKGEAVLERAGRPGTDFAALAKEVSQGPSAAEGGDLGWLRRGTIQAELERAAFALQAGQISGLVKTRTGFHILKVEERRIGGEKPLAEVKDQIRDRLVNQQLETYRKQYVADLRRGAHVEVRIPELR